MARTDFSRIPVTRPAEPTEGQRVCPKCGHGEPFMDQEERQDFEEWMASSGVWMCSHCGHEEKVR